MYQISILLLVLIGIYYFISRKMELLSIEKLMLSSFALYSCSFLIYIFNDQLFSLRDIDHPSRFFLLIPLYFVFKEIKSFKFLEFLIFISTFTTSSFVIINFVFFDVWRSYNNSCISGAQISLILGSIALFISFDKKTIRKKIIFLIPALMAFLSVVLSETRGVMLCIPFLTFCVVYLRYGNMRFKNILLIITLSILSGLTVVNLIPTLEDRLDSTVKNFDLLRESIENDQFDGTTSIEIRYNLLKYGYLAFLESPFFGSGRKGFKDTMVKVGYDKEFLRNTTHSHNQFISDLVMRGLFGFFSTILFISVLIFILLVLRRKGETEFSSYGMVLVCSYVMFFLTDSPFIGSMHATLFFIFCYMLFCSASFNNLPEKECP